MKKYFKNTWVSYILVFVACYILFIFEPFSMYANNLTDFWFDYRVLWSINSIVFLLTYLIIMSILIKII